MEEMFAMQMDLEGPALAPLSCGKAVWLIVLLHGLGADGNDLIDMAINWQPDPNMLKAEFVALHAPFPCDSVPQGRQWFSVQDRSPEKMLAGLREAADILNPALDAMLEKRRLDDSHLALVGFSQGAMLALHAGLRRPKQMAGIVAFSGALQGPETLPGEILSKPPVFLVHGDADTIVPYDSMANAKAALKAHEVPVKTLTRAGLGHAIDDDGVYEAGEFLSAVLQKVKSKAKADAGHDDHDHDDHDH
jgi:phospholipase/carboxylesterase